MKTAQTLRENWNANATLRNEFQAMMDSPAWQAASTLVAAEATKAARGIMLRGDGDAVLARLLMKMDGVHDAIEVFQSLARDPEPAFQPEADYDDEYIKKLHKQKTEPQ